MVQAIPSCFDTIIEYKQWRQQAKLAPVPPKAGMCWDCTPQYAAKMRAEKRCRHRRAQFVQSSGDCCDDADVHIHGLKPAVFAAMHRLVQFAHFAPLEEPHG